MCTLMALAVSSKTPRRFGGPPLGLKSTKIVPGKSSLAMIMNGFDPSKLSEPSSVTIFPLLVIFLYNKAVHMSNKLVYNCSNSRRMNGYDPYDVTIALRTHHAPGVIRVIVHSIKY